MPKTIKINARDLDQGTIKAIQDEFGNAELEIRVHDVREASARLTEDDCWEVIDLLDWSFEDQSDEQVVEPLVSGLSALPIAQIYQFADWLSEKLWLLDTAAHATVFLEEDGFLSVDDFLYARCAVVANGKAFYEEVLQHPDKIPTDLTFESLLYLPQKAYHRKTGEEMVYVPLFNYETYGNKEGWNEVGGQ